MSAPVCLWVNDPFWNVRPGFPNQAFPPLHPAHPARVGETLAQSCAPFPSEHKARRASCRKGGPCVFLLPLMIQGTSWCS